MVWQKKASAPAYVNLAEASLALITGTPDAWAIPWWNLVDRRVVDVAAFCATGPENCDQFGLLDFAGFAAGGGAGTVISGLQLVPKLDCFARNRLFGAYCEQAAVAGATYGAETCTSTPTWSSPSASSPTLIGTVPSGATSVHIRVSACDPTPNDGWPLQWSISSSVPADNWSQALERPFTNANLATWATRGWTWEQPVVAGDTIFLRTYTGPPVETCVSFNISSPTPFVPPPIVQPPNAIAPPVGVYGTIADLGAELDKIENKLHWILEAANAQAISDNFPQTTDGAPAPLLPGDVAALGPEVTGVIVAVSNIGNQTDLDFGDPVRLHRLGRVVLGTSAAWLPPIEISVTPMMLTNFPPGVTRCTAHVVPPATVTVQRLQRAKPVG